MVVIPFRTLARYGIANGCFYHDIFAAAMVSALSLRDANTVLLFG